MPQGYKQYDKNGKPKVLKLNRTLYGLCQSPRSFWLYLTKKLEHCGLKHSQLDPCLFIGSRVICIQEGLIKRIIEALGLDMDQTNAKGTPAERKPLEEDENGEPQQDTFNYVSVVRMLLYLLGHTRPDLAYSVSQVARFMFNPKHLHKIAIKRIGRYLIRTNDKGMIIKPTADIGNDAYPNADFAGLYGYKGSHTGAMLSQFLDVPSIGHINFRPRQPLPPWKLR